MVHRTVIQNRKEVSDIQVSNAQANQQLQAVQRAQQQNVRTASSSSEEAHESPAERAAEAQKTAVAQTTGVGSKLDIKF